MIELDESINRSKMSTTSKYLKVIVPGADCELAEEQLAATYPYSLDNFQKHAIQAINAEENVLVTAKTGSGKTLVGEYQIAHSLKAGRRVFYTTPVKSLSNQKYNDLKNAVKDGILHPSVSRVKNAFPEARVGIMTGDIKCMPDADVVIMTTEILRNLLLKQGTATAALGLTASLSLENLDAVVFDECHYINDPDRGRVWEETLILLPHSVKVVLLSATIDRPELFASWVGQVRQRPISLIATTHRVVPLTHFVAKVGADGSLELTQVCATNLATGKEIFDRPAYRAWQQGKYNDYKKEQDFKAQAAAHKADVAATKAAAKAAGEAVPHGLPAAEGKYHQTSYVHQLNLTVNTLKDKELLPAIFFVFDRKMCEKYAAAIEGAVIDSSDAAEVAHIINYHLRAHKDSLQTVKQYHQIVDLLKKGIGYHHSGLLPVLKEIVEILFAKGLVKVLFCTETFAVGINMPTRTVVFTDLRKHDNGGMRPVRADEYIQMAGRAGRRGKDVKGTVIYLPAHKPLDLHEMAATMGGSLPVIQSRMEFSYEFILKTFHAGNDCWLKVINESYWYQQEIAAIATYEEDAKEAAKAVRAFATANHLNDDTTINDLNEYDKLFAAVKTSVNAERKAAQRALDQWNTKHVGPKWLTAIKAWPEFKTLVAKATRTNNDFKAASAHLTDPRQLIQPKIDYLVAHGFLELVDGEQIPRLTQKGVMATEVNEGHPIMMTELYLSGALKGNPNAVAVLAAFMTERSVHDDELESVYDELQPIIDQLLAIKTKLADTTDAWRLSTQYVNIAYDWINGKSAADICESYNIFEGNLTRLIMKLYNLQEELNSLATISNDVATLDALRSLNLIQGIAVPDSLYLKI